MITPAHVPIILRRKLPDGSAWSGFSRVVLQPELSRAQQRTVCTEPGPGPSKQRLCASQIAQFKDCPGMCP